ncbi:DUF4367 domain-containing protein [Acetivibrio clariflavus]|uniref:DUF4367 domain-containing protein n=1 Tax=Acetivibrio clariflavus (strain DSM 19732 / NBRC 101661 / EBR45) TaxID=720554 RepID=G8LSY7_ACECE|nr:DUF4367 domain-containing protein [Acetivibrio clariflavus]AEV70500.1 hypothetical protein Clocl_4064 [Acetivibrio clariflavus DSM 19732]
MVRKWKTVKEDTDLLIEIAYKTKYSNIKCPPKEEVWSNIKNNLNIKQKRVVRIKSLTAAAFFLIFATFFFLSEPTSVGAFANKIIKNIINITEDTFSILKKVNIEDGLDVTSNDFDDPRLAETQSIVNFDLTVPKYMPKGYVLESIKVLNNNKDQEVVSLSYANEKGGSEKDLIQIEQQSNPDGASISLNVLRENNSDIKKINTDTMEYVLIFYENGFCKFMWDTDNISYAIFGKINEDEMIKIAESMR